MPGKSDIRAGGAFVELFVKSAKFEAGLRKMGQGIADFGGSVASFGTKIAAIGAAGVGAFAAAAKHFADTGDELNKMSQRTGASVESLSQLKYAVEQSGASLQDLETGLRGMSKTLDAAGQGGKQAIETLGRLGLTLDDLKGLTPDQQLEKFADALSTIEDPAERAALAMKVFGKSGTQLLPLFADGAKGIKALRDRAAELGLTIGQDQANAATLLGDAWDDVTKSLSAATVQIGAALAPALTKLAEIITSLIGPVTEWIRNNQQTVIVIASITAGIAAAGIAITAFGGIIVAVGTVIGGMATMLGALTTAATFLLTPLGIAVGVVAALGAGFAALGIGIAAASGIVPQLVKALEPVIGAVKAIANELLQGEFARAWEIAKTTVQFFASTVIDVLGQLPEFVGYAAGRITAGIVNAFQKAWVWVLNNSDTVFQAILTAAKGFSGAIIEAMLTGDVSGVSKSIKDSLKGAAKGLSKEFVTGFKGGEAPELRQSERTKALQQTLLTISQREPTKPEETPAGTTPGVTPPELPDLSKLRQSLEDSLKGLQTSFSLPEFKIPEFQLPKFGKPDDAALELGGAEQSKPEGRVTVGFSAAGLLAQGMGGGKDVVPRKLDKQLNEAEKQTELLKKIDEHIAATARVFG